MNFEEALKRLEEIVKILEKGETPLDDAIALFEEGISLKHLCQKKLEESERKIKVISEEQRDREEETLN